MSLRTKLYEQRIFVHLSHKTNNREYWLQLSLISLKKIINLLVDQCGSYRLCSILVAMMSNVICLGFYQLKDKPEYKYRCRLYWQYWTSMSECKSALGCAYSIVKDYSRDVRRHLFIYPLQKSNHTYKNMRLKYY